MITLKNPKCWHYSEIDPEQKANCPNCHHWNPAKEKCKDHALLNREIENLMRHDGFTRGRGGIKQVRRG